MRHKLVRNVGDGEQSVMVHKPSCARCLNRGMECVFNTKDDSRGTAPKSLVMQLQARIQQVEQVLWLHSIDVESSIAQLRAGHLPSISPSRSQQQSREEEPFGALCANGPFGLHDRVGDEEEVRFFSSNYCYPLLCTATSN
ncbi:uncharacterized protein BO66DRAFT_442363 [Aspergillus aculeatinus CBS 121060]|uniref:Uncharacterized protein n=1 Tax=Aspergillus aculeatinus CBS 121060 TaxID=1448322 RepID=A0ACD1GXV5_9EURO|nr:hypothetical protein BO66DRAFT_442363 [Aspergillus aculeatinus CBS 121060]RAH66147.1 hypothetical protein BO66DRAFT_442363 [Aspergillus aculeatinus CBS 121060]